MRKIRQVSSTSLIETKSIQIGSHGLLPHLTELGALSTIVDQFELRQSHSRGITNLAEVGDSGVVGSQAVTFLVLLRGQKCTSSFV